jgi:rare lipoprotein A
MDNKLNLKIARSNRTMGWGVFRLICGLLLPWALVSCTTTTTTSSQPSPQPAIIQDGAPDIDVDVSHIPDAQPRHELVTEAGNKTPYEVLGKTYRVNFKTKNYSEIGYASWYGKKFHDYHTSNGELYDMLAMTAAHKTLAIPTYVRVHNLENGRSIVVRVNDRGPFHEGRIIDLSYAAAKKLGFHLAGTTKVRIEVVEPAKNTLAATQYQGPKTFFQMGAFTQINAAQALCGRLKSSVGNKALIKADEKLGLYKVLVGPILHNDELNHLRSILSTGYSLKPILVRWENE